MAERRAVALHLVLASFGEGQLEQRGVAAAMDDRHLHRTRRTVVEHDATSPALERARDDAPVDLRLVHARQSVARMQQAMRERAVVRHQQRALDVPVEATYGIEPRVDVGDELAHHRTPARIADRRDVPGGLVQQQIVLGFRARQRTAVDGDDVALGIGERGQLACDGAVDGDAAVGDEPISSPPARQPRLRQDLVEPEVRHRP